MTDNDSSNKQPWAVPILVAIVGMVGTVAVAWINKIPQSKLPTTLSHKESDAKSTSAFKVIGWIRIGAVDNTKAAYQDNAILIASSEKLPVTITPMLVPKDGTQITIVSSVNVRKSPPTPPNYNAQKQALVTSLLPETKVRVVQKRAFVDPRFPSTIAVWAQVTLP